MKTDPLLNKAARLAKKRDYEGALKLLRAEEDRYYGSFKYYYLCGVVNLHAGIFLEAKHNFDSAKKIKMKDPSTLLGLAVLYLRGLGSRGTNTSQAVDYYLDVLEFDPKNKIAKNALTVIRKYSASEDFSDWLTAEKLSKLYPPIPFPAIDPKILVYGGLGLCAILILVSGLFFKVIPDIKRKNARASMELALTSQERASAVETGGSYMYILTRTQATDLYDRALSLFTSYRDEAAKINLNRILESNASQGIKNKSRLIMTYMEVPGFDSFKRSDNSSFSDVKSEPVLYRDVHIIWRGMATNVEITDEYTRFDFLVGYDTRTTLEGIITVIFNFPVSINPERPLEVLGRIVLLSTTEIQLAGLAIHQSGRLEN